LQNLNNSTRQQQVIFDISYVRITVVLISYKELRES
jgi:hypothetical protein